MGNWENGGQNFRELGKLPKKFKELGKEDTNGKWEKLENKFDQISKLEDKSMKYYSDKYFDSFYLKSPKPIQDSNS